jgi:hypothetical protein
MKEDMLSYLVGGGVPPLLDIHRDHNEAFFPTFLQATQVREI